MCASVHTHSCHLPPARVTLQFFEFLQLLLAPTVGLGCVRTAGAGTRRVRWVCIPCPGPTACLRLPSDGKKEPPGLLACQHFLSGAVRWLASVSGKKRTLGGPRSFPFPPSEPESRLLSTLCGYGHSGACKGLSSLLKE